MKGRRKTVSPIFQLLEFDVTALLTGSGMSGEPLTDRHRSRETAQLQRPWATSKPLFHRLVQSNFPVSEPRRFPPQLHDRFSLLTAIGECLQQNAFIAFLQHFDLDRVFWHQEERNSEEPVPPVNPSLVLAENSARSRRPAVRRVHEAHRLRGFRVGFAVHPSWIRAGA